jgi:hypothetical protein
VIVFRLTEQEDAASVIVKVGRADAETSRTCEGSVVRSMTGPRGSVAS